MNNLESMRCAFGTDVECHTDDLNSALHPEVIGLSIVSCGKRLSINGQQRISIDCAMQKFC